MSLDPAGTRPLSQETAEGGAAGWWRRPFSVFQTNLQEIDATQDVEKTLDFIEDFGADTWLINTGGIVSFYPTELSFQTRNPFLADRPSGDLIGDAVTAAHRRGIRVASRVDFSKVSSRIAREHPDWLFVSPKGEPQIYNTLFSTCPSADYYQHRSLDILDEIIARYPVDGFFFNWFGFSERDYSRVYHGVCHCQKCQEGFSAFSGGKALPDDPRSATYPEWLRFSNEVIETLTVKIANHITTNRPDAALMLGRGAPVIFHEANNAIGRELWHHNTAENVGAHATGHAEARQFVNSVSFVDMPYRMAGEQPEHFAQYLLQTIARGGNPSTYIMGAPGRIPYPNLAFSSPITKFHRKHRDLYANLRQASAITKFHHQHLDLYGQLQPASSIALVRPDRLRSASPGYAESVEEFRGLYCCLQEKHLPFDVLAAELLTKIAAEGGLQRYALIVLPDLGALGHEVAAALDDFVGRGGNLVLTGTTAVSPDGGVELATGPALMRIGKPASGEELWSTYVTASEQPGIGDYRYAAPVIPVFGSYSRFVWRPGVEKIGEFLPPAPFGPPEKCYGHAGSDDPDLVRHTTNRTVVHIPWSIGRSYREFGTTEIRDHFLSALCDLTGQQVFAELPEQVELFIGRDDDGYVVHLLNQSGARRKSFGPHLTVTGGRIRVKGAAGSRPRLLVSQQAAGVEAAGEDLLIELPPLELFEVLRIPAGR